jgi:hypothetical protein
MLIPVMLGFCAMLITLAIFAPLPVVAIALLMSYILVCFADRHIH